MSPASGTLCGVEVVRAFKYRIDPAPAVEWALLSHAGGSRFAYNHLLSVVKANWDQIAAEKAASGDGTHTTGYVDTSQFGLLRVWASVRDAAAPWWAENSAQAYNDAAIRLSRAFTAWRRGTGRFPTFHRKGHRQSVKFCGTSFGLVDRHHIRLAKVGEVKTYESMRKMMRHVERGTGTVSSVTIKRETGGWFAVFIVTITIPDPKPRTEGRVIGVDLGINTLVAGATPDGGHVLDVENPRHYVRAQRRLAHAQRVTSRRQGPTRTTPASKRWERANRRVQAVHAHVRNQRVNGLHEITSRLVKDHDVIVVETLNIKGMLANKKLAKHIADAGWGEFVRQLEYKCTWSGAILVKVDRWYPSSKTCSSCGAVKAKLALDERMYECNVCGVSIDRDVNAAINLARHGCEVGTGGGTAGTSSVAGRGGVWKTDTSMLVEAAACETSTATQP
jgi:putative transposase